MKLTENLAREAQEAAYQRNMKELYSITRKLSGRYKHADKVIKDKN